MRRTLRATGGFVCAALLIGFTFTSTPTTAATRGRAPSRVTVRVSPEHSTRAGDEVTIVATIRVIDADGVVPSGTVEFFDAAASLGSADLSPAEHGATATFTVALGEGVHPINARYSGDDHVAPGVSAPAQHAVGPRE